MLLDAGGAGVWFDYIQIYAPGKRYQDFNLLDSGAVWHDLLLFREDGLSGPPADMAADARLIARASTGTGHNCSGRSSQERLLMHVPSISKVMTVTGGSAST
jgi:hypothetical protein